MTEPLDEFIQQVKNKFRVVSHTTGRNMGTFNTAKAAKRRLAQVNYFKTRSLKEASEVITGNLCRGEDGKFSSCGDSSGRDPRAANVGGDPKFRNDPSFGHTFAGSNAHDYDAKDALKSIAMEPKKEYPNALDKATSTHGQERREELEALIARANGIEAQGGTLPDEVKAARDKAVAFLKKLDGEAKLQDRFQATKTNAFLDELRPWNSQTTVVPGKGMTNYGLGFYGARDAFQSAFRAHMNNGGTHRSALDSGDIAMASAFNGTYPKIFRTGEEAGWRDAMKQIRKRLLPGVHD